MGRKTFQERGESFILQPCESDEWLHDWVKHFCGINVPRKAVCPGHDAPFEYLKRAYFEPTQDLVVWAPRGGGKTRLGAVATLALVLAAPASTAPTATASVQIVKTGFVPATVGINSGDSVTWRNADTKKHQVVANGGQFASAVLDPGKTYSHTFDRGGTYRYHDALYPALKGTVNVKGPPPSVTLAA